MQEQVRHDYYAEMDAGRVRLAESYKRSPWNLASGLVDERTLRYFRMKYKKSQSHLGRQAKQKGAQDAAKKGELDARDEYMRRAKGLSPEFPQDLRLEPDFSGLSDPSWLGLEVEFKLIRPWYSRDDRIFHLLDNPVRKDRVFGVPYMSAASWKGLLRWACWMQEGQGRRTWLSYKDPTDKDSCEDSPWIVHLFGNARGEKERFRQGALVFFPTWFSRVDYAVINPHSRESRAGTIPITYEVVPEDTNGVLRLLYAPLPGAVERDGIDPTELIHRLLMAIQTLLETYGISAKRTAGWGTAQIEKWRALMTGRCEEFGEIGEMTTYISNLFLPGEDVV
jgi:CRISPR-associated protein Cmr2